MNILESKTTVVERTLVTKDNNNREVFISINEDYIKKLNISVINVTQLPMLVIPYSLHRLMQMVNIYFILTVKLVKFIIHLIQ